ncbi:MAG: hypothetical protein HUU20_13360, partial [Pirellulales bacterium]|nr:hypothetical protein [Pirellulales bacterium]
RRNAELNARLADFLSQRESLENQERELEQTRSLLADVDGQAELVRAQREQLESDRTALEEDRRAWDGRRAETEEQLARRNAELDTHLAELLARRESLENRERELDHARSLLADLDGQAAFVRAQYEQLESDRAALEERLRAWNGQRTEMEQQLAARGKELDRREADLQQELEDLRRRQAEWKQEQCREESKDIERDATGNADTSPACGAEDNQDWQICDKVQFQSVSGGAPLSSLDVFRRIGTMPDLGDEDDAESTPARPATRTPVPPPRPPQEPTDDEDSVDSYMARLLERVRATSGSSSKPASYQASENAGQSPTLPTEPMPVAATLPTVRPRADGPVELSPRAVAPEKHVDLSAMRELANFSAQTAINRHTQRKIESATRTKLLLTLLGLGVGLGMLWAWWYRGAGDLAFCGALASLSVALVWGVQCAVLAVHRGLSRAGDPQWKSEGDSSSLQVASGTAEDGNPETPQKPSPIVADPADDPVRAS